MRILHVSLGLPPWRTGGLTKYSVDLMLTQLELQHEVAVLYPGRYTLTGNMRIRRSSDYQGIQVYEMINPLPVPLLGGIKTPGKFIREGNRQQYAAFLKMLNPDIIHVHTWMGIHKEFLEAAKQLEIRIVFTSHDYFGICPKVNLFTDTGDSCENYLDGSRCAGCNQGAYSMAMIQLMQSRTYRYLKGSRALKRLSQYVKHRQRGEATREPIARLAGSVERADGTSYIELRRYYMEMLQLVDRIHFNSSIAAQEYARYGSWNGEVMSITHRDIHDRRTIRAIPPSDKPLRFTYVGPVDHYKGFFLLHQSLQLLKAQGHKEWHLHVYGSATNFNPFPEAQYTFHGRYSYQELPELFGNTDLLIIPSLSKETFGFIGLEALSYGVPVMVTDTVGFQDLIQDGLTGLVVRAHPDQLANQLRHVIENREVLSEINRNIMAMDIPFSMVRHTERLMKWYSLMEAEVIG